MAYPNGEVPLHLLVKEGEHYFFPGTYARWKELQRRVHAETGVWLYITPGPNAYRTLAEQKRMRQELGVNAAVSGRSSHGGLWTGQTKGHSGLPTWVTNRESGAIDVGNWFSVPWDVFTKHARAVGFIPDIVVPTEKWHLVDLNPWRVPAAAAANIKEDDLTPEQDRMLRRIDAAIRNGSKKDGVSDGILTTLIKRTDAAIRNGSAKAGVSDGIITTIIKRIDAAIRNGSAKAGISDGVVTQVIKRLERQVASQAATTAGLSAAVKALSEQQGIDPQAIQSTIDTAVRDALKDIEITLKAES